jgi:hypothetical protein
MAEHVDLTDPELHEPKGIAAASVDTVYVADGAGTGTWQKVGLDQIEYSELSGEIQDDLDAATIEVNGKYFIHITLEDISTLSSVLIPVRVASTFIGATSILGGPITVADANISFKDNLDNNMATAMVVAFSGSARGDIDTFTATSNNSLAAGTYMEVETDGGSTDAAQLFLTLEFEAQLNG